MDSPITTFRSGLWRLHYRLSRVGHRRFFSDFMPGLRMQSKRIRLRVGSKFIEEWQVPRRWSMDDSTPFERVRTLDPAPVQAILDEGRKNIIATSLRRRTYFCVSGVLPASILAMLRAKAAAPGFIASTMDVGIRMVAPRSLVVS